MTENKTLRILKMLMMLSGSKRYKLEELAGKFNMSERNIIRDLNEIESAGFVLERKDGYRLPLDHNRNKNLNQYYTLQKMKWPFCTRRSPPSKATPLPLTG